MKRSLALAFGLVFCISLAPRAEAAQFGRGAGRDRVCVYQDIRFQGWEQCYGPGDEVANLGGHNNNISSIRIFGRASVTVYEDTNFRNRSAEFSSDVPDLGLRNLSGNNSWSDRIESLRVSSGPQAPYYGQQGPANGYPPPQAQQNGVCVYDRPGFQGRSQCWAAGESTADLARSWSDRVSSIRVFGGTVVTLYQDIGFRGETLTVDRDIPDLNQVRMRRSGTWNHQVSSLQIERERGRDRGRRF